MNAIYKGAEAVLYKDEYLGIPVIKKERKPKEYRIEEVDKKIRTNRIKKEARMMKKARKAVKTPYILQIDQETTTLTMEEINGKTLKERIKKKEEEPKEIGKEIGRLIKKLHGEDIIHNDLTTSNMIRGKDGDIYFIDFGLAGNTEKVEDKAMDLLVFKKMLKSTHWENTEKIWRNLKKKYGEEKTLERLKEIEGRRRYT